MSDPGLELGLILPGMFDSIQTDFGQTYYNGSSICPGCAQAMNPIQVMYGAGLCPQCQARKNAAHVKGRMSPNG